MKIKDVLNKGIKILKENNVADASLTARLLLSDILGCRKEDLVINQDKEVEEETKFLEGIEKISRRLSSSIYNRL